MDGVDGVLSFCVFVLGVFVLGGWWDADVVRGG